MFTGIVSATGRLRSRERRGGGLRLEFEAPRKLLEGAREGDSMCVSGVCLTMLRLAGDSFSADVSAETLERSTLGQLQPGDRVNLEPALRVADRLGGHLVSGHVDSRAGLVDSAAQGAATVMTFEAPTGLSPYIAAKGSVCLDGVSLTVNRVKGARFEVCIIPHTLEVTTLGDLAVGAQVNIEVDMIARYLERLAGQQADSL